MNEIENINKELSLIIEEYSKTTIKKRYISDEKYINLNKKLKNLEAINAFTVFKEDFVAVKNKNSNIQHKHKKDTSNFDNLSDNVKEILSSDGYDLERDKYNIINFHHKTNQSKLSDKVMKCRIKEFNINFNKSLED
ncbi:MAG: hypothetical protein HRT40_02755 [Campylobacteraceae bacterium]|nr:hypothetical protein [Campylobacteraceae bacterium]